MESSPARIEGFEKSILMVHSAVGRIRSWLFVFYLITLSVVSVNKICAPRAKRLT